METKIKTVLLENFRVILSEPEVKTWITPLKVMVGDKDSSYSLVCDNDFTKKHLGHDKYWSVIKKTEKQLGINLILTVIKSVDVLTTKKRQNKIRRKPENQNPSVKKPLTTSENTLILKSFELIFNKNQTHLSPVFVFGNNGVGKTTLGRYFTSFKKNTLIITAEEFVDLFFSDMKNPNPMINKKFFGKESVFVDNVEYLEKRKGAQLKLAYLMDKMIPQNCPFFFSSNKKPEDLNLDSRLKSRVLSGLTLELKDPSFESKSLFMEENGVTLEERSDLTQFRSFRDLKGFVVTKKFLKNHSEGKETRKKVTNPEKYVKNYLETRGFSLVDLQSRKLSNVKSELTVSLRSLGVSFSKIANLLRYSNHSSAIYAYKKFVRENKN